MYAESQWLVDTELWMGIGWARGRSKYEMNGVAGSLVVGSQELWEVKEGEARL